MPHVMRPPSPPRLPAKLPGEAQVDAALTRLAQRIEHNPLTARLEELRSRLPEIEAVEFPTPLGTIRSPHFALPEATPPRIDERRRGIVKAALGMDLAQVVGLVPVVGDVIADAVEDTYYPLVSNPMTEEERRTFQNYDKVSPLTSIAVLATFAKSK